MNTQPNISLDPEHKKEITAALEEYAKSLSNNLKETLNERQDMNAQPDYETVAEQVWEQLNEMDSSLAGQLINGAIYGAVEAATAVVQTIVETLLATETEVPQSTTAQRPEIEEIMESAIREVAADIATGSLREPDWEGMDMPEVSEAESEAQHKDYLAAMAKEQPAPAIEPSQGMER